MKIRPKNPYLCPICLGPIDRLDLKTCGASDCLLQWRQLTSQERTQRQADAAEEASLMTKNLQSEVPNIHQILLKGLKQTNEEN